MRVGKGLYTNWLRDDLLPLSDAPRPEHPFKDPNFNVELFISIGEYSKYWRDKGYSINVDGEVVPKLEPHSTWVNQEPVEELEFRVKDWQMIADTLQKYYKPDGKERI